MKLDSDPETVDARTTSGEGPQRRGPQVKIIDWTEFSGFTDQEP